MATKTEILKFPAAYDGFAYVRGIAVNDVTYTFGFSPGYTTPFVLRKGESLVIHANRDGTTSVYHRPAKRVRTRGKK